MAEQEAEQELPARAPPWPVALPPQLPALRALAASAGADTFFHLWNLLACTPLAIAEPSALPIYSVVTADDAAWARLLPPRPLAPALLRRLVGAGLTATHLSLTVPSTVRTVGGGTLVVEPGEGGDPLTVNDQAAVTVVTAGRCSLILVARPPLAGWAPALDSAAP
jgi:hypothetical protein